MEYAPLGRIEQRMHKKTHWRLLYLVLNSTILVFSWEIRMKKNCESRAW